MEEFTAVYEELEELEYEEQSYDYSQVDEHELAFVDYIIKDPSLFLETKISYNMLEDPLARVIYMIIGERMSNVGQFKPLIHLKPLVEDEDRMLSYSELDYPLEIKDAQSIVDYFDAYFRDDVAFRTLEDYILTEYQRRAVEQYGEDMISAATNSDASMKELLMTMSSKLDQLLYQSETEVVSKGIHEISQDMMQFLESDDVDEYAPTGIDIIDKCSGGTTTPAFICLVANAKAGKSALIIDTAIKALQNGRTIAIYSIEMSVKEVYLRLYANFSGIDFTKITKKTYDADEKQVLLNAVKVFEEMYKDQLYIHYNPSGLSPKAIEHHVITLRKAGVEVQDLFIDYMQLLTSSVYPHGASVEQMGSLPAEIRRLCQKLDVRVFAPAQLRGEVRDKEITKITGNDVHFIKGLEKECHVLLVLHEEDGMRKIKYLVSRFEFDHQTYCFPKLDLNKMSFGPCEVCMDEQQYGDTIHFDDAKKNARGF